MAEPLKLNVVTTVDDSGLTKATAAAQQLETATTSLGTAAGRVAVGHREMEGEMGKATKTSSGFGKAAVEAAMNAGDLQGGLNSIIEIVPGLAVGMALVTGAASLLGLNMDELTKDTEAAADAQQKLTTEAAAAVTKAQEEADAHAATALSLEAHEARVQALTDRYKELLTAIDLAARARETMARNILAETNAEAALQLARVEAARASGQITDQESERQSLTIKQGAAEREFAISQAQARAKETDLAQKAAAAQEKARSQAAAADNLGALGSGMLTEQERKVAEAQLLTANQQRAQRDAELQATPQQRLTEAGQRAAAFGGFTETEANPAFAAAEQKLAEAVQRAGAAARILDRDQTARERSGIGSADDLAKEQANLQAQAAAEREKAAALKADAELTQQTRFSQARIFSDSREQSNLESGTRLLGFDQRDSQQQAKAREEAAKKRGQGIKDEGGDLIKGLKGTVVPDAAMAELQRAMESSASGSSAGTEELRTLLRQLSGYLKRSNQASDSLAREMEELRQQLGETRTGR